MKVTQFPDRTIVVHHQKHLYFGGTAYLGLPTNKKFQKIIRNNIKKWGTAYGSSRGANVKLTAYDDGEKALAKYIQAEDAVTVSSGMLAGKIVLELLQEDFAVFYHFPNSHKAIQTPDSLPFYIDGELNPRLLDAVVENIVLLTDSVPTSCVVPIDLSLIGTISKTKCITLVLDESHSLGIVGDKGCGLFATTNFSNVKRKIMISSLGKALGITGGVIASDADFIYQIKTLGTFVSAAGMNPAYVQSVADGMSIIFKQHTKLLDNLTFLHSKLIPSDQIVFNPQYPLLYPMQEGVYLNLLKQKIVIVNFKYPTPSGELNRVVITANHKKKDLAKMANFLQNNR